MYQVSAPCGQAIRQVATGKLSRVTPPRGEPFTSAKSVANAFFDMSQEPVEVFCVLLLDQDRRAIGWANTGRDAAKRCVSVREILWAAIQYRASRLVYLHNHPEIMDSLGPTQAERDFTERLAYASRCLEVPLLDHIILANGGDDRYLFYSFDQHGLLDHRAWE